MTPVAPAVWPAVRRLAPLRWVVSREPVHGEGGRILYHNEQLQCGHVHAEFSGGNPGKRRRCRKVRFLTNFSVAPAKVVQDFRLPE